MNSDQRSKSAVEYSGKGSTWNPIFSAISARASSLSTLRIESLSDRVSLKVLVFSMDCGACDRLVRCLKDEAGGEDRKTLPPP